MSVRGRRAEALVREVLTQLKPELPPDLSFDLDHGQLFAHRLDPARPGFSAVSVNRVGATWLPWAPTRFRARITAQDAVETVLDAAWGMSDSNSTTAEVVGDRILVRYPRPHGGSARLTLPMALCR